VNRDTALQVCPGTAASVLDADAGSLEGAGGQEGEQAKVQDSEQEPVPA
jgi:hypothetical protein